MRRNALARITICIGTMFCFAGPSASLACGLRLVLAMDVSASVSVREYNIQRTGLATAFRDEAVHAAIQSVDGGILVSVTQWAGSGQQDWSLHWSQIWTPEEARAFAIQIEGLSNPYQASPTAVGQALRHASEVLAMAPSKCRRSVIDVSSDGATNTGMDTAVEADALDRQGVTINALVILGKSRHKVDPDLFEESLTEWYGRNVVRGPGSFVVTSPTYEDFPRAIRNKLLREIRPLFAMDPRQFQNAKFID